MNNSDAEFAFEGSLDFSDEPLNFLLLKANYNVAEDPTIEKTLEEDSSKAEKKVKGKSKAKRKGKKKAKEKVRDKGKSERKSKDIETQPGEIEFDW